jgi:hypothetical protein
MLSTELLNLLLAEAGCDKTPTWMPPQFCTQYAIGLARVLWALAMVIPIAFSLTILDLLHLANVDWAFSRKG